MMYTITNGPSREVLFDALRLRQEKRLVNFEVSAWEEGKNFSLIVGSITSLDRVGDLWKVEGFMPQHSKHSVMITFDTTKRRGGAEIFRGLMSEDFEQSALVEGVCPERAIKIIDRPNRSFLYVKPAVLSAEEVGQILNWFNDEVRPGMKYLLVNCRNNPYSPGRSVEGVNAMLPCISCYEVNPVLKEFELTGRKFRLASRRKAGTKVEEYQLWQITDKEI